MRHAPIILAVAALCALPASSGAARPQPTHDSVLVALLLPFAGHVETGAVRATTTSISAVVRSPQAGQTYRFALSRRISHSIKVDASSPLLIVGRSSAIHAEKNQDIEVENDEAHFKDASSARSMLLLAGKHRLVSCGAARTGPSGAIANLAGDGVNVVAALRGRKLHARITCDKASTCRLMEEEGIFYFAREPCSKPAATGTYQTKIGPDIKRRRGDVMVGF